MPQIFHLELNDVDQKKFFPIHNEIFKDFLISETLKNIVKENNIIENPKHGDVVYLNVSDIDSGMIIYDEKETFDWIPLTSESEMIPFLFYGDISTSQLYQKLFHQKDCFVWIDPTDEKTINTIQLKNDEKKPKNPPSLPILCRFIDGKLELVKERNIEIQKIQTEFRFFPKQTNIPITLKEEKRGDVIKMIFKNKKDREIYETTEDVLYLLQTNQIQIPKKKHGTILKIKHIATYRNDGLLIFDDQHVHGWRQLDFDIDDYGNLPCVFTYPTFPFDYWNDKITHNYFRWIDNKYFLENSKYFENYENLSYKGPAILFEEKIWIIPFDDENWEFCEKTILSSIKGPVLIITKDYLEERGFDEKNHLFLAYPSPILKEKGSSSLVANVLKYEKEFDFDNHFLSHPYTVQVQPVSILKKE